MATIDFLKTSGNGIFPKGKRAIAFLAVACCCLLACDDEDKVTNIDPVKEYEIGKNYYTMDIDGDTREYYVHVPAGYDAEIPTPVVLMLHGASGSGEGTYNKTGWTKVGESENIITVFPTALVYCYTNKSGESKTNTRWNSYPPMVRFCDDQTLKDDVKYLKEVIAEVSRTFNVDSKRIYMVGFSSGGQMSFRCAVEMGDLLAAVVQSGGTHHADTVFVPKRELPISFELGNRDASWFKDGNYPPLSVFDTLLKAYPLFRRIVDIHTKSFGCDSNYTMSGDENAMLVATFKGVPDAGSRQFNFTLIKGLDHSYPNGNNHSMFGARVHWNWMKQYSLP